MSDKLEKLRLHFFYCSVILALIIIAIATDRWTLQPKFTEFLSNAATMTSLVLGLVAIFYSFISNDGLSKSLGSIGTVSDEIKSSREQIGKQVAAGIETTKAAERSAGLIEAASSSIGSSLTSLSATLAAIQAHTEVLHGSLAGLPTRLDQLETKVINATRSLGQKPADVLPSNGTKLIDPSIVQIFLDISSVSANIFTYACVLAYVNKKELQLGEFSIAIGIDVKSYYFGFLDSMDSIQLVRYKNNTDQSNTDQSNADQRNKYTFTTVHPHLVDNTKSYIIKYLEKNLKHSDPENYERWTTAMKNVETLFK